MYLNHFRMHWPTISTKLLFHHLSLMSKFLILSLIFIPKAILSRFISNISTLLLPKFSFANFLHWIIILLTLLSSTLHISLCLYFSISSLLLSNFNLLSGSSNVTLYILLDNLYISFFLFLTLLSYTSEIIWYLPSPLQFTSHLFFFIARFTAYSLLLYSSLTSFDSFRKRRPYAFHSSRSAP